MTAMTTIISTLATRVAFHANPGRIVSALVLTRSSFRSVVAAAASFGDGRRQRGGPRHLAKVTFVTPRSTTDADVNMDSEGGRDAGNI
jgi:hypothetical protein